MGYIPVGNLRSMGHLAPLFDLHWFHDFFRRLIFELFFFTNADVVTIKHLHKIRETNRGEIKEQDVPFT